MNEVGVDRFRRTSRLLPIAIFSIGAIAILAATIIFFGAKKEAASRSRLEVYNIGSQALADRIAADAVNLRWAAEQATKREVRAFTESIHDKIKRIVDLQRAIGDAEFDAAVGRLELRFDRVARHIDGDPDGTAVGRENLVPAIESLALAADQLERLHAIEVHAEIDALGVRFGGQAQTLIISAALIALFAFIVSWRLVIALNRSFEREQAVLSTSRERLAHAQKIEALGRLAGGIAHDFNNLLTVILVSVESMRWQLPDDSELHEEAHEIETAGEGAASLARQLLAFSRREVAEALSIDLNDFVSQSQTLFGRVLREDIVLVTELESGLEPVSADPARLRQVVLNLVLNACDALPSGGTVTIQTASLPDGIDASIAGQVGAGSFARLTVIDNGVGIPAEIRSRVFDPYFTSKPRGKGTGLGLAIVSTIVEESGGYIACESEEGVGSRFDVFLPLASGEPAAATGKAARPAHGGTETILVAEDQRGVLKLTTRILTDAGFDVLPAADGGEALRICEQRKEPIDLILTDVVMPGVTGPKLAELAETSHPEARILFMSGYADDDELLADLRDSPERLLRKPFRRDRLLTQVRAVLDDR